MDCMGMFQYNKTEKGIRVLSCRGLDDTAMIPETIEKAPVTELASYVFSKRRMNHGEAAWSVPGEDMPPVINEEDILPLLCGERVKTVIMPLSIEKIGNYAFYNCYNLEKIVCHSTIKDLGSGMFSGCNHISQVDITIHEEEKSCMKELLSEIRQRVTVRYRCKEGEALLIFPEFFEEAVENTPARILYTATHGTGHRYRYCFQDTRFHFKEYDSLFIYEMAGETTDQALELALYRLVYPLGLSVEAKSEYMSYVTDNWSWAADLIVQYKDLNMIKLFLLQAENLEREMAAALLDAASHAGFAEACGYLLEYMRTKFPTVRKKFTL